MQVIDEVVKVPRSIQRQVPMIQEMQQDQKPEEAQISFKMYVDRGSECKERAPHLVFYIKGRKEKDEVQKDQTSVHKCKAKCKALREKSVQTKRLTMNSRERQPMKRCQTCGPFDLCAHVSVEACPLTTRHKARSQEREEAAAGVKALRASFTQIKTVPQNSRSWEWPPACMTEREESSTHVKGSSVPTKPEKQVDQVSHIGVGPRSGSVPRGQSDTEIKDHAVG